MLLPPVIEGQLVSTQSLDVPPLTAITVAHTTSSSPAPQTSPWARDSEQVTASEALFMLHEGPRTSQSSTMPDTIPETQDISQEDYEVIIPRRSSDLDTRPYPILVDPNATTLPLQSTPLDESSGIRGTLGTQFVSPVFSRPPPAQKALQFYPEISHPPPPISAFPLHQLNLEPLPFAENPRPQSKPDTLQIFAIFQHWGNRPVSIDDLKIIVIGSASSHASSFNTLGYVSHQVLVICWLLSPLITSLPFCCL